MLILACGAGWCFDGAFHLERRCKSGSCSKQRRPRRRIRLLFCAGLVVPQSGALGLPTDAGSGRASQRAVRKQHDDAHAATGPQHAAVQAHPEKGPKHGQAASTPGPRTSSVRRLYTAPAAVLRQPSGPGHERGACASAGAVVYMGPWVSQDDLCRDNPDSLGCRQNACRVLRFSTTDPIDIRRSRRRTRR